MSSDPSPSAPPPSQPDAEDLISINIKAPGDTKLSVSISLSSSVLDLKKAISDQTNPRVEPDSQRLIYSGRVLKDDCILSEYKIKSGHSVHMVKGAGPRSNNPTPQIPSNLSAGQQIAGNPLAPLLNATNQIPGFNPFADMGINTNNPNMAMNMMNNPQMLQNAARLLEDPAVVEQMIASDARLQSMGPQVREMLRSPLFRQMITNPDMMRSMQGMMGSGSGMGMGGVEGMMPSMMQGSTPTTIPGSTNPVAAALGAQPGADPTGTAGPAGMDPLAFMNTPFGRMAMQQMVAAGGGGGGGTGTGMGSMFGGMGLPTSQPADPRPPEERFEVQLGQLQAMGFTDARQNIRALQASGGNVEAAIEYILGGN